MAVAWSVIWVCVAGKLIQIVCCLQHPQSQLQSGESAITAYTAQYCPVHVRCNYSKAHTYIQYTQAQATTISGTRHRSQPSARTELKPRRLTALVRARNFSRSIKSHSSSKRPKNSKLYGLHQLSTMQQFCCRPSREAERSPLTLLPRSSYP